ncbi:hypothetical protein [Primorskyibacter sp. S87]|uniref:hypothetical protein n=1 Tax=Primorskyibacter sp. S87 TaxID=3415126 RepID=UPI003C7DD249
MTEAQADEINAALREFADDAAKTAEADVRAMIGNDEPTDTQIEAAKAELLERRRDEMIILRATLTANMGATHGEV